jgi:FkbM family methyltransferase
LHILNAIQNMAFGVYSRSQNLDLFRFTILDTLFVRLYFLYKQYFEKPNLEVISRFVGEGDFCIDVGGGFGFYAVEMAKRVGKSGFIISCEPDLVNYKRCLASIQSRAYENQVDVRNIGLSSRRGIGWLQIDKRNPANHKVIDTEEGNAINLETVDELFNQVGRVPSFVKIDVQGHELEVLKGASSLIAKKQTSFLVEIDPCNDAQSTQEIWGLMVGNGYSVFMICKDGTLSEINELPSSRTYFDLLFNFVI